MTFRTFSLITLLGLLFTSCETENSSATSFKPSFDVFSTSDVKKVEFKDPKSGTVISTRNYPSEWNVDLRAEYKDNPDYPMCYYQISDSKGLKIHNDVSDIYIYFDQAQANQMMAKSGFKVKPVANTQSISTKVINPKMAAMGFSFKGNRTIPEFKQLMDRKAQEAQVTDMVCDVLTSEWTNAQGQSALTVLTLSKFKSGQGSPGSNTAWVYSIDYMFTNTLEEDLGKLTASLDSDTSNPQWIAYQQNISAKKNQQMAAKNRARMQQSQVAHQQRMNARQNAFNSHQQMIKSRSAAMDQSHQNFMNNLHSTPSYSSSSSSGHDAFINMIQDEETIYNSSNGNSYEVEAGYDNYWMDNNSGDYYGTNDAFFNPNYDTYNNGTNWTIDK